MKYFAIENSLNNKIQGKIPQIKEHIFNCHVDNPNFIDNLSFSKIELTPILANVVLYSDALKTDLIESNGSGFSFGSMIISEKLKKIFDNSNVYGVQYFKTEIIQRNETFSNYFQTHIYDFPFQYIDFKKTNFILKDRDINRNVVLSNINFKNFGEFSTFTNDIIYPKMIEFKEISFNSEMNLDYFFLRFSNAIKGIVSENLKNHIESQKCTGIEFRPIELSYDQWHGTGKEREKIYGKV